MRTTPVVFTPSTVIDMDIFTDHLFLRPAYHHYYFGDYYATNYADVGIYPWFAVQARGIAYDPIYVHRGWVHRDDHDWHHHLEDSYRFRTEHVEARPPRTLNLQLDIAARPLAAEHHLVVAHPLTKVMSRENQPFKFHVVATAEREKLVQHAQDVNKGRTERVAMDTRELPKTGAAPNAIAAPVKAKLPPTAVVAKKAVAQAPEHAPPPQPEVAKRSTAPATAAPSHPAPQPLTPRPVPPTATEKKSVEPTRPSPAEPRSVEPKPVEAKPLPPRPVEPKPAEPMTPPVKKPTEPPPSEIKKSTEPPPVKKSTEPPPPARKPVEPPPSETKKPAEPPSEMKRPVEPPPPVKKSPEPPPPTRKPPEPMPPPTSRPTEPPSEAKKEPSEKRPPQHEKDRDDDDDKDGEPTKGKSKKKDDK
jgi:hypothetical protein